ncbi:MAG: O-acetylhomoserine aminocarboxypropyltransferase/cysteine synthase, partial [Alistipes sp.]|nr:O-acetylhomoserine aminocarboxypropyltransferase/cysteine synthase [Alistipes sp.]
MSDKKLRFETRQIHGGYHVDHTGSRGVAIYPTAAYHFKSCEYAANLFELSEGGNIYTRLHNPTTSSYEERIASLYGAVGALAVSSGMASILITVTALAKRGENIVASPFLYGGTYNQFRISLRNLGIECRIAKSLAKEDFEALVDENTKMI